MGSEDEDRMERIWTDCINETDRIQIEYHMQHNFQNESVSSKSFKNERFRHTAA